MRDAMRALPVRLRPQQDLRGALEAVLAEQGVEAGFVLQAIGSLSVARIRFAGVDEFAEQIPSRVISMVLGLPADKRTYFQSLADTICDHYSGENARRIQHHWMHASRT